MRAPFLFYLTVSAVFDLLKSILDAKSTASTNRSCQSSWQKFRINFLEDLHSSPWCALKDHELSTLLLPREIAKPTYHRSHSVNDSGTYIYTTQNPERLAEINIPQPLRPSENPLKMSGDIITLKSTHIHTLTNWLEVIMPKSLISSPEFNVGWCGFELSLTYMLDNS